MDMNVQDMLGMQTLLSESGLQSQEQMLAAVNQSANQYMIAKKKAESKIRQMTEELHQTRTNTNNTSPVAKNENDKNSLSVLARFGSLVNLSHKDYLKQNREYLGMQAQLASKMNIDPVVAAYALFSTNFNSVESAMDFIYEKEDDIQDGRAKFVHTFVGCLPNTSEFTERAFNNLPYLVDHDDLEDAILTDPQICYICDQSKAVHKEETIGEDSPKASLLAPPSSMMRTALITALQKKISETRDRIQEEVVSQSQINILNSSNAEDPTYCPICYTNVIQVDDQPLTEQSQTIEFECGHRFCTECTLESFKGLIEAADLKNLKCYAYECGQAISNERVQSILTVHDQSELNEKFKRFSRQSDLNSDPLVRWCPQPECGKHMRAASLEDEKLICSGCQTEVCFKCRDVWHGADISCEQAMKSQLEGWADENKDNVSFCPTCRTKIEKNQGCNHMTCGFCGYEFCWACGESASSADNHFSAFNGCGVGMMDESVKPGDSNRKSKCCMVLKYIGLGLLCIILYPFVLVLYVPICGLIGGFVVGEKLCSCIGALICCIIGFVIGVILDICFIPLALIATLILIFALLIKGLAYCLTCKCCEEYSDAENENRQRAEQTIKQKLGQDDDFKRVSEEDEQILLQN